MRFYKSAAMTANHVTSNLITGITQIEWIRGPAAVRLSGSESLTTGGIVVKLIYASRALADDIALGGANRSPVFPDDVIGSWRVPRGAQGSLVLRETLGGTPTYFIQLDVDYR